MRYVAAVIALLLLLTLSALFSTGIMAEDDRQGLALLFSDENAVGSRTAAAFFFVFLVGYAACNVLLLERLLGNIAQHRKPTALRAALTAVCAILAAACEGSIASVSDELLLLFFWGIPGFAVLAALLLFLTVLAIPSAHAPPGPHCNDLCTRRQTLCHLHAAQPRADLSLCTPP